MVPGGPATAPGDTRARVIRAAADLFATRGFAGTSISAIRDASGAMPSSIYWEFGSKEGLIAAVLRDAAEGWLEQARESIQRAADRENLPGPKRLEAALDHLAQATAARPEFHRLLLLLALERRDASEETLQIVRDVRELALQGLAHLYIETGVIRPGTSRAAVEDLTRATLAFFDGALVAAQIDPETTDLRRMFSLLRTGIGAFARIERNGGTAT